MNDSTFAWISFLLLSLKWVLEVAQVQLIHSLAIGRNNLLFAGVTNIFQPTAPILPRRLRQKTMSAPII